MKVKEYLVKMLRDMIPVILGVLIALLVNGWKEQLDDKRYLNRMLDAIDQEVAANLLDIEEVLGLQVALLDTISKYEEVDSVTIAEILSRANGMQSPTIKNAAWQSLTGSRLELVDFELIAILTEISETKDMLALKLAGSTDFLFTSLHEKSKESKQTFTFHITNMIDSEQALIRRQQEFQRLRED